MLDDTIQSNSNVDKGLVNLSGEPASGQQTTASNVIDVTVNTSCYRNSDYFDAKYVLVACAGTSLASCGILLNVLILLLMFRQPLRTAMNLFYPFLILTDLVICICYVAIFSVEVLYEFYEDFDVYLTWLGYIRFFYTLSKIALSSNAYIIVALAIEQYLAFRDGASYHCESSSSSTRCCSRVNPHAAIIIVILVASFALRASTFWELSVEFHPKQCSGLAALTLKASSLGLRMPYRRGFKIYFSYFMHVFLPYLLLILLGMAILLRLKWSQRAQSAFLAAAGQPIVTLKKELARPAIAVCLAVVFSYLSCALLGVVVNLMEYIRPNYLYQQTKFYVLSKCAVALLYVLGATLRPLLLLTVCAHVRDEFKSICGGCVSRLKHSDSIGISSCHSPTISFDDKSAEVTAGLWYTDVNRDSGLLLHY